jgi:hypothetical protein
VPALGGDNQAAHHERHNTDIKPGKRSPKVRRYHTIPKTNKSSIIIGCFCNKLGEYREIDATRNVTGISMHFAKPGNFRLHPENTTLHKNGNKTIGCKAKKSPRSCDLGLNPPKEEGGGDNLGMPGY